MNIKQSKPFYDKSKLLISRDKLGAAIFNFFKWKREWGQVKIGTYGEEYQSQFDAGITEPYDKDAEFAVFPIQDEVSIAFENFLPTAAERAQLLL